MQEELSIIHHPRRCQHLLSKGLYINAGCTPGQEITGDGNFWCGKTLRIYGPDDQMCDGEGCLDSGRDCYVAP
jgi:hypothetical protein